MKGLSNILTQIENEASQKVSEILTSAQNSADEIISKAKAKAESEAEIIKNNAEVKYNDILSRSDSANELKIKREILAKKQELINQTIDKAMQSFLDLPDEEYFNLIETLVKKHLHKGENGEIIMSERDKKRMPTDFVSKLDGLKISDKTINADGGFILSYGDIEENCTFKAIFESKREEMMTTVNELLFD